MWNLAVLAIFCASVAGDGVTPFSEEKNLVKLIVDNYAISGKDGRPVEDPSEAVETTIGFTLIQILGLDQENQILEFVGWVTLEWEDVFLSWDPSQYGNVTQVMLDPDDVWTPDIILFNAIEPPHPIHPGSKIVVSNEGKVHYVREYRYKATCVTNPGNTKPACALKFGSWTHSTNLISLFPMDTRIDAEFYVTHHGWELLKTKAVRNTLSYPCCPHDEYDDVTYTFSLKMRPKEDDEKDKHLLDGFSPLRALSLTSLLSISFISMALFL